MLTTSCPKCEKEVTVPSQATAESRVRCPLCSEEYSLEPVFAEMPPLLELLDAPATNGAHTAEAETKEDDGEAGESAGMFDFDQGETDGDTAESEGGIGLADPVETEPKSSGFEFGQSSSSSGATTTAKPRPRKKSGSPVKAIIGVIVGGLFAIPIAQLTLWYLPGGWDIEQRDPMQIGRKLSGTFASFLVPSWVADPNGADNNTALVDNSEDESPDAPGSEDDESEPYEEPGGLGSLLNQNGTGNKNGNGNGGRGNNGGNNSNSNNPNGGGNNAADGDEAESGDDNSGSGNQNSGNDNPPESRVKDAPSFNTADLSAELTIVKDEVKRFDKVNDQTVDFAERKLIRDDFFKAAGRLAEVVTFVDEKPQGHREHLDEFLTTAANSTEKRRIIGVSANLIIKNKDRDANGIIIAGEVKEFQKRGQLHEAVITLDASGDPPISVYGTEDLSKALKIGDDVMILGVIIDKPVDKIRGFKGPRDDAVIWGGYSHVVPALDG